MRQINVYNPRENRKRELYPGRSSRLQIFHQRKMAFIFGNISQRSSNQDYGVEDTVHWTVLTRWGHILSITPWDRETGRNQEQSSDLCHWIPHQSQAGRDCPRFQTTPLTGSGLLRTADPLFAARWNTSTESWRTSSDPERLFAEDREKSWPIARALCQCKPVHACQGGRLAMFRSRFLHHLGQMGWEKMRSRPPISAYPWYLLLILAMSLLFLRFDQQFLRDLVLSRRKI